MIHELKIKPEFFEDCACGKKTFEVRLYDRPFEIGDYLALNEWDGERHTGRCALFAVTYILDDEEYCKPGYVIMSIEPCAIDRRCTDLCCIDREVLVYDRGDTE